MSERRKTGIYIMYADIDYLKWINDKYGHEEGDRAIIEASKIFIENYRTSDIIGRVGGDEFGIVPVGTTKDGANILVNRFQKILENFNKKSVLKYKLSISVGIVFYDPETPCSLDELLKQADKSMYEQKKQNRKMNKLSRQETFGH